MTRALVALSIVLAGFPAASDAGEAPKVESKKLVPWKGTAAPALGLKDLEGKVRQLEDFRGQVVLVNFWATWCVPCREEMPSMQRLKDRFKGRPFAVVAVNYGEDEAKVQAFLQKVPLDFHVLLDPAITTPRTWGVRVLPSSYLIGADGQPRLQVIGEFDWSGEDAVAAVGRLLVEMPAKPAPARQ